VAKKLIFTVFMAIFSYVGTLAVEGHGWDSNAGNGNK